MAYSAISAPEDNDYEFDFGGKIMHHLIDDYEWHFFDYGDFHGTLYFPVIVYSPDQGWQIFSARKITQGRVHNSYTNYHGNLLRVETDEDGNLMRDEEGNIMRLLQEETDDDGNVLLDEEGNIIYSEMGYYDFSITKNVINLFMAAAILLFIFLTIAKRYRQNPNSAPRGMQSFFEPIILFIRDEIAKPNLHQKTGRYLPYLLTIFFFILISNFLGLIPGAANLSGNIAFTATLAFFTFLITNVSGNKHYWAHIFAPPGVPWWLWPIMWVVEVVGIFIKPCALAIRLFAIMNAGHMIILSLVGLIFVFGLEIGVGAGYGISIVSIAFLLFMYMLKLLVSLIQAYIFTTLSALFIGQAVTEVDHESEGLAGHH